MEQDVEIENVYSIAFLLNQECVTEFELLTHPSKFNHSCCQPVISKDVFLLQQAYISAFSPGDVTTQVNLICLSIKSIDYQF